MCLVFVLKKKKSFHHVKSYVKDNKNVMLLIKFSSDFLKYKIFNQSITRTLTKAIQLKTNISVRVMVLNATFNNISVISLR